MRQFLFFFVTQMKQNFIAKSKSNETIFPILMHIVLTALNAKRFNQLITSSNENNHDIILEIGLWWTCVNYINKTNNPILKMGMT